MADSFLSEKKQQAHKIYARKAMMSPSPPVQIAKPAPKRAPEHTPSISPLSSSSSSSSSSSTEHKISPIPPREKTQAVILKKNRSADAWQLGDQSRFRPDSSLKDALRLFQEKGCEDLEIYEDGFYKALRMASGGKQYTKISMVEGAKHPPREEPQKRRKKHKKKQRPRKKIVRRKKKTRKTVKPRKTKKP